MATKEQIDQIMERSIHSRSANMNHLRNSNFSNDGMIGVLILLHRSSEPITAGQISEALHISNARVTTLIKKMVDKGLIIKTTGATDARVTEVRMTDHGREVIETIQKERMAQLETMIDQIGIERLLEYFDITDQIRSIMSKPFSVEL